MRYPFNTYALSALAIITLLLSTASCSNPEPDVAEGGFTKISHLYADGDQGVPQVRQLFVDAINNAEFKVDIALAGLADEAVADALIAAHERGVEVRVVTDTASLGQAGIQKIQGEPGIALTHGDGELKYLPDPLIGQLLEDCERMDFFIQCQKASGPQFVDDDAGLLKRPEDFNIMSDNFAIVDELIVVNVASPLDGRKTVWFGWTATSQDLSIAFAREFQQLHGGVFANSLDAFNGPLKSTVHGVVYDSRIPSDRPGRTLALQPGYLTDQGIMRVEFNPQQRLVKEALDPIYRARGSVFMMTDEIIHSFVTELFKYKHNAGFDVRLIVRSGAAVPQELVDLGIVKVMDASYEYLPTVILTDAKPDRNGVQWARTASMLSHGFYYPTPFEVLSPVDVGSTSTDGIVRVYPSDLFVDGTMWTLREFSGNTAEVKTLDQVEAFTETLWDKAQAP